MPDNKIYVGTGKARSFDNGGSVINISLCLDGMSELYKKYGHERKGGKKYINLTVSPRRAVGQYGETHTVAIDTWKPDGGGK